jgi:D-methionine transport system permease protein
MIELLLEAFWETLTMVGVSAAIAALLGVPLGVLLVVTGRGHILENAIVNRTLGVIVNATRSTPFIILLIAVIPFTRLIVGTSIGTAAAIVPLTIAAIPFVARLAEAALREVDPGLIEAAAAMGATPRQIIFKVLIPESWPGIIAGLTVTVVSLIGYSAMAGAVGGGGLGDLGIRYGYQRFQPEVMAIVVIVLIVLVQSIQSLGDGLARKLNKRLIRNDRR